MQTLQLTFVLNTARVLSIQIMPCYVMLRYCSSVVVGVGVGRRVVLSMLLAEVFLSSQGRLLLPVHNVLEMNLRFSVGN